MNSTIFKNVGAPLFAALAITVSGCKKDQQNEQSPEALTPSLTVNVPNIVNGTGALEQTLSITSNVKWTGSVPEADASWLSIDKTSGEKNSTIKITVKANTGNDPRAGKVVLKGEGVAELNIPVNQKGLIEWQKAIPNNNNSKLFEVSDGYVVGGQSNGNMYIYKVNKTTMELMKSASIQVTGYAGGSLVDMEPLPGGGFIATGYLNQLADGSARDAYVFQLSNDLEVVKGMVHDFGTAQDIPYAIHPLGTGYVLAFYKGGSTFLTKLNENLFEVEGTRKITSMSTMSDLKATSDAEIVATGSADGYFAVAKYRNELTLKSMYKASFFGKANAAWVSADNKVAVAGYKNADDGTDIFYIKLDANLDPIPGQESSIHKGKWDYAYSIIGFVGGGYAISGSVYINNETQGYSLRLDNNLSTVPGKEVFVPYSYFIAAEGAVALNDGSYLLTGYSRGASTLFSNLIRINP